jgi:hypothetical protein
MKFTFARDLPFRNFHHTQTGNFAFAFPEILGDSSPDPYKVQCHLEKQYDVVGFTAGTSWRKILLVGLTAKSGNAIINLT